MPDTLTKAYLDKKLDAFATSVQRGFQDVHKELKRLDNRLAVLQVQQAESDRRIAALDARLTKRIDTLTTHVDQFITLHKKLDQELLALRAKYERLEDRMTRVEQQLTAVA